MTKPDEIVDRYLAVWSEPDPEARRRAVTELWTPDGVEYVEGVQFRGHDGLEARVAEAFERFGRDYTISSAGDVAVHDDLITFTIQLVAADEVAWAARVFLLLTADGRIGEDYHLTVRALTGS